MIPRYSNAEMSAIWSDQTRYSIWLEIEILACEAWASLGKIPQEDLARIKRKATFNLERIAEIEAEVHHDVIAFLTSVAETVGDSSRYIHYGLTSSDVLDTCLSVQIMRASDIILKKLDALSDSLKNGAKKYKGLPMMGRSHGIHAEPTTFGLKMALFYSDIERQKEIFSFIKNTVCVGMISGPVGTYSQVDPLIQEYVCKKLGLGEVAISTQVIQRDRHAHFLNALAVLGACLEKIAVEVRGLQRTEVGEVAEFFSSKQKGSSAMPHKKNPIISERLTGMARLLRGYASCAMEDVALWHERDISHSSVERVILPDATILLDYMLDKATQMTSNLSVYKEKMAKNIDLSGELFYSQSLLLALADKGMLREDAYRAVQKASLAVIDGKHTKLSLSILEEESISKFFKLI